MREKIQRSRVLTLAGLAIGVVAVGITAATVLHTMTLENTIRTPTVEGAVKEELDSDKKVSFLNTGEADVFLRASFTESWEAMSAEGDGIILANHASNASGTDIAVAKPTINTSDWVQESDGWYYYKKIIPGTDETSDTDKRTTSEFITGVNFGNLEQLPAETKADYAAADYQIHVAMEVVQASDEVKVSIDAVDKLFDMSISLSDEAFGKEKKADGRIVIVSGKYDGIVDWQTN